MGGLDADLRFDNHRRTRKSKSFVAVQSPVKWLLKALHPPTHVQPYGSCNHHLNTVSLAVCVRAGQAQRYFVLHGERPSFQMVC